MSSYVYLFSNQTGEVIYVGRTNNIISRLKKQHFTKNGHLPESCYNECFSVKYAKVESVNESRLYELYLISKFTPIYNTVFTNGGELSVELPELDWRYWDLNNKENDIIETPSVKKYYNEIKKDSNFIIAVTEIVHDFIGDIKDEDKERFKFCVEAIREKAEQIKNYRIKIKKFEGLVKK
jgi:hypothetical protein